MTTKTTEAPTPEEIAEQIASQTGANVSHKLAVIRIAQALRTYGDRRYIEARDAAARVAEETSAAGIGKLTVRIYIAEAIRELTPEGKP